MEEIEETDNYSILTDYDDGVVCFGTLTQSQIERFKRLPRRTVLPSDIESIRESIANSKNVDENDENDQSTSIMDESGKNTTIPVDDSCINDVNETENFLNNEEATSTMKLKQSFTYDSSSNFSSPCGSKFIPSENLIDTETINTSIRMESLSPNETFSEDQNKSAFAKDETASLIDDDVAELSTNNFSRNETSSWKSSVSSVIEQSLIKNHKVPDIDGNICSLQPCTQQEDEDISYCYDSEFDDTVDYSIVPDKYSITPGKQRLFDSRHAQSSIRAKSVVFSVPFMDKIEETTTPVPKSLNSSPISIRDVSYGSLENEDNVDKTSVTRSRKSSDIHYNLTYSGWDSNSEISVDDTAEELSKSTNLNISLSENNSLNYEDCQKSAIKNIESSLHDSIVEQTYENNLQNNSTVTNYKKSIDFDTPLKIVNETSTNASKVTSQIFDADKSMKDISNVEDSMADTEDYNYKKVFQAVELIEIKSINCSLSDTVINETMHTSLLSSNGKNKVFDISNDENSYGTSYITEPSFDVEKSMTNIINTNGCNNEESEAMEVDIKSTNTSVVDNVVGETISTCMLSTNNVNEDLNETSQAKDTLNVVEPSFGVEKSISIISNVIIPNAEINSYTKEYEVMEVDIKSTNTSVVDNVIDETMSTSMLSTNDNSKNINKLLTETSPAKDTVNVAEQSFDVEKSLTKDTVNVAEQSFDVEKSLNNMTVSSLNGNDASLLSNCKDNALKHSTNFEKTSEKLDNIFTNEISETSENIPVDPLHYMRQYLEFEQTIYNMCNDVSSDTNQNKSNNYGDQTLDNMSMVDETQCTDSFDSIKDDDKFSSSDNSLRPKLSIIIENRTLEENCNDTLEQNEHFVNPINDLKTTSQSINEIQDDIKLNESTNQNQIESELNIDNKFEITKSNKSTTYGITDENLDKTELNISSLLTHELSKTKSCTSPEIEGYLNVKSSEEHFPVSEDVEEICANQSILNNCNLQQPLIPTNMTSNSNVTAIKCTQQLSNVINSNFEQNRSLDNDILQPDLLSANSNIYDNSLDEYNKLEEMFYSEENKQLQTFDYKTPKVQKLLDFSIMQQNPTSVVLKQKLLNFSIVDQTPNRKSTQVTQLDKNSIGKKDTLIDFSAVGQILDLDVTLPDKIDLKNDFQHFSKDSMLKNLSEISAPDLELLADESILTNSSCQNNLSLNKTITDTTNLNLSTYGITNESKDDINDKNSEDTNVKSLDSENCSTFSINKQLKTDEQCSSLDKTIEQVDLKLFDRTESKQNKSCNEICENETTIGASVCTSNINLNQSFKKPDSTECEMDPNQPPTFNSNVYAIKDFSIIEGKTLQIPESKENTNSMLVGSHLNVTNLIEMSVVPDIDVKSNGQALVSSGYPLIVVTPNEKLINSSDEINSTAIHIEEHMFSHNPEFLTDIQMNDVSLLESLEKSSVSESFHSIELDQLQEDNKRKTEPDQEHHSHEKKMKVATKEPSTPMSMLYKLRNMFKSSEKPPITKSNNENDLKSNNCHQKLNFSNVEENKNKSICYKKPEVMIKSKIPCKISDKSMSTSCEFNSSSSSSLNDSIKPKKGIPRFIGALSDVSNSSNRNCLESRIPSKLNK